MSPSGTTQPSGSELDKVIKDYLDDNAAATSMSSETQHFPRLYVAAEDKAKSLEKEIAKLEAYLEEVKAFQERQQDLEVASKHKSKARQLILSKLQAKTREVAGAIAQHQKDLDELMQQRAVRSVPQPDHISRGASTSVPMFQNVAKVPRPPAELEMLRLKDRRTLYSLASR